jgi:hypothetical protein
LKARMDPRRTTALAALALAVFLLAAGCSWIRGETTPHPGTPEGTGTPSDIWSSLLRETPYPYAIPLPSPRQTVLDGTYTKIELKESPPVKCARCPAYSLEGGVWKLRLDRGVYRILNEATGWRSMGSFALSRDWLTTGTVDQLVLFNDPNCPDYVATYTWRLEEDALILEAIEDSCGIHLRAKNLTNLPWLSCQPPNIEAGSTDHWQEPPGCD